MEVVAQVVKNVMLNRKVKASLLKKECLNGRLPKIPRLTFLLKSCNIPNRTCHEDMELGKEPYIKILCLMLDII